MHPKSSECLKFLSSVPVMSKIYHEGLWAGSSRKSLKIYYNNVCCRLVFVGVTGCQK